MKKIIAIDEKTMCDKCADYVLSLKGNQEILFEEVKEYFENRELV